MTAHRAPRALGLLGTAPSTTGAAIARVQLPSAAGGGRWRLAGIEKRAVPAVREYPPEWRGRA